MSIHRMPTTLLALACILLYAGMAPGVEPTQMDVTPRGFSIGTFFSGQEIHISGVVPSDLDIIIEVKGPQEKELFNMKAKVGPFWMNREKVEIENTPFLYGLLLPEDQTWEGHLTELEVGLEYLKRQMDISPPSLDLDTIFSRFVQLKQTGHLYQVQPGTIHYSPAVSGQRRFEAKFEFPASTVPGEYTIKATWVQEGLAAGTASKCFSVEEVGMIRLIRDVAYQQELIYGIMCVIIALCSGMLMGLFFKGVGGH